MNTSKIITVLPPDNQEFSTVYMLPLIQDQQYCNEVLSMFNDCPFPQEEDDDKIIVFEDSNSLVEAINKTKDRCTKLRKLGFTIKTISEIEDDFESAFDF